MYNKCVQGRSQVGEGCLEFYPPTTINLLLCLTIFVSFYLYMFYFFLLCKINTYNQNQMLCWPWP